MMREPMFSPPVIVREDLVSLARGINAEHLASERDSRSSIEHARNCGDMLIRAKAQLARENKGSSHGHWMGWVALHVRFSQATANAYMQVAKEWAKFPAAGNLTLRGALAELADQDEPTFLPMPGGDGEATSDVEAAEEAIAATIASLSPEDQLEVLGRTEERIERQAAARAALAPAEAKARWLGLGLLRLGVAVKYFRRPPGDENAEDAAIIEEAGARIEVRSKGG